MNYPCCFSLQPGYLPSNGRRDMGYILWIIAAVLVIWGVMTLLRGSVLAGIALIVIGLLVGPGGYSIFA